MMCDSECGPTTNYFYFQLLPEQLLTRHCPLHSTVNTLLILLLGLVTRPSSGGGLLPQLLSHQQALCHLSKLFSMKVKLSILFLSPSIANTLEGFAFSRAPTDPSYQFDISGVFANGTTFFFAAPVTAAPTISTSGNGVSGDWGNGLGYFEVAPDRSQVVLTFNNEAAGFKGSIVMKNQGTPPRVPCNTSFSDPYFTTLSAGKTLNPNETILYEQTGWAVTMPRAAATVKLEILGSAFELDDAVGYHDHNWASKPLDQYAYTWLTGQGSCGPFDLSYLEVQALGSPRSNDVTNGFLAYEGEYLQNECSLYGSKAKDYSNITLTGQTVDPITSQTIPTGIILDYFLANGSHYQFPLTNSVQNPDQIPYHRWTLTGKGGLVGGPQYDCLLIGDWLNPGLATYTEGKSIFEEQALS
jgi:hypothetical protein